MAVSEKLMTAEELLAMPADDLRHELVKGELLTMAPANALHGRMAMRLGRILDTFVMEKQLGVVFAAETGFVLATDPDTVRAPDVAFVVQERIPQEGLPEKFWSGAPDLAAEIVSPGDSAAEVQAKVTEYLAAGTQLVWIVHPKTKTVTVYKSLDDGRILTETDALQGGELLPGFSVAVRELFA